MADFEFYRRKRSAFMDAAIKKGRLRDEYQDEETKADPKHGREIVKKIRDEAGFGDRIPVNIDFDEDIFEEVLADDRGGAILYEDNLNRLSDMVEIAEHETAERRASSDALMERLFDIYFKPEVDLTLRRNVVGAFQEYNYAVELTCRKLAYIRTACIYYGVWMVKEIPVDRIVGAKIKQILGINVGVYKDNMPLRNIPGFIVPWDGNEQAYIDLDVDLETSRFDDLDSIQDGIEEIRNYVLRHPQQVDVQCLMSVVTGTEGLAENYVKARALDEAMDRFSVTEEGRNLPGPVWRKLFNDWIVVKTFVQVARLILDFVNKYKMETVGVATDALEKILPSISYAQVQRNCRIAFRQMILEGSSYEFPLSQVALTGPVKKAVDAANCISFSEAPQKTRERLLDMIKRDKRPIHLPSDADLSDYQEDLSFICEKGGETTGAVFVSHEKDRLVLDLLYSVDNTSAAALIVKAHEAAVEQFGSDQMVLIPVINDRSALLVESLVPGAVRERAIRAQIK